MPSHRAVILTAILAAVAGVLASLYFEPSIAYRLAGTEVGQRAVASVLRAQAPPPPTGLAIAVPGQPLPKLQLHDSSGASIQIPTAWHGRATLVNFWATWCAPCLKEMPDLQAFATTQGADGVRVVGIALDEANSVRSFLQTHGITYPILLDVAGPRDASVRYGNPAGVLPYSILVSADGRLLKSRIGPFLDTQDITRWAAPAN